MTDLHLVISSRTAARFEHLLRTVEAHLELSATERDTVEAMKYALEEAHETERLRDRLAAIAPGPLP